MRLAVLFPALILLFSWPSRDASDSFPKPVPVRELSEGELTLISGIGPVLATAITAEGNATRQVYGIGESRERQLRKYIRD